MKSFKSFLLKFGIFSIITLAIPYLWQNYASARFQTNLGLIIWAIFVVVTLLNHYILLKAADESPKKFVTYFMGLTGLRLFLYLIIVLIFAFVMREAALGFTIMFLAFYFLYSAFEVVTLLRFFKK